MKASGNPFDVGQAAGRGGNEVLGELQSSGRETCSEAARAAGPLVLTHQVRGWLIKV